MPTDSFTFRPAGADDARELAELINFAGDGMPLKLWETMAGPGETAWEVGRTCVMRDEGGFSWRNATVADRDGRAVAGLIGYRQADAPAPIDYAATPAAFVPLLELENLAPATWYVNVLAACPDFRGHGLGTRLLGEADRLAAATGCRGLSIIVSDANTGARRLYERCGYVERASRPKGDSGLFAGEGNWVLLVK